MSETKAMAALPASANSGTMLLVRILAMLLPLGLAWCCLLVIPYVYRLATNAWAAPALHGDHTLTGKWIGVIKAAPVPVPDLSSSPFLTERHRAESLQDYSHAQARAIASTRVLLLDLSLDYFYLSSARISGTARVCSPQGDVQQFKVGSGSISQDAVTLQLYNRKPQAGASVHATRDQSHLSVIYQGLDVGGHGQLEHGDAVAFQKLCQSIKQ